MEVFEHKIHWCPTFVLSNNFQKWSNGLKTHVRKISSMTYYSRREYCIVCCCCCLFAEKKKKESVIKLKQRHSNHFLFTAASMCALSQRPGSQCANVHTDVHLIRSTLSVWSQPKCLHFFSKWIFKKHFSYTLFFFLSPFLFLQDVQIWHTQNAWKNNFSGTVQIKDSQCTASYAILDFPVIFTPFGL